MSPSPSGCWADSLGDCQGPISAEHVLSVSVWESTGPRDNRAGRVNRDVTVSAGSQHALASGVHKVNDLTDMILCKHHNNTSSPVDNEAGNLRRAILGHDDTVRDRGSMPWITSAFGWYPRVYRVDGPLIERWFLKTAINGGLGFGMPLGGTGPAQGRPTKELCEMVWGSRPVAYPIGLYLLTALGDSFNFSEKFEFIYWDVNSQYIGGCLFRFRGLRFAMNFGPKPLPHGFADSLPEWRGLHLMRFRRLQSDPELAVGIEFTGLPEYPRNA